MKVDISQESFDFLKSLIQEIDSQSNRATASPYYYVIQVRKERIAPVGNKGDKTLYWHDGEYMEADDWADSLDFESEEKFLAWWEEEHPYEEPLEVEYYRGDANIHSNVFFTEKACHKHIEQNHYHFIEPHSYVKHAWRNPEMENLFKAIREIVDDPEG